MAQLDLAVIGNCAIASLIDPAGRHVWFCFPRLDSDPLFNALVHGDAPQAGFMDIAVRDVAQTRQSYLRNTPVLETVVNDQKGAHLRILDFAPRFKRNGRIFRPPLLVRRIEPLAGRARVTVRLRPTFDYGSAVPSISVGSNHLRFVGPQSVLRATSDMPVSFIAHEAEFVLDRPVNLFVGHDETVPEEPNALAQRYLEETIGYWHEWVRDLAIPFDWQEAVIRAAITLKLCSYEDTGAIVAALTTSIPEAPGSGRNWDYRFCWPRDSFFTVNALNRLGATLTMERYIRYILNAVLTSNGKAIAPLYPIVPGTPLEEHEARYLSGFRGMGPVRVGNAAFDQRQNDVYGSIVLTAAQMFWDARLPVPGDAALYGQLCDVGMQAKAAALEPDAGLWEFRGRASPHTFSASMCWAAVHRLGLIAQKVGANDEAERWLADAEVLRDEILRRSLVAGEGWISGALDARSVDASVLLLPEIGLLNADDPRFLETLQIVDRRLTRDGFILRYDEADDFGLPETAFLVCSFWHVDALAKVGRREEALELFERILACRNHVGLLSEDVDPRNGVLWGNFPQTYSLVGLIMSAMRLSRTWREGLWRSV